MFTSVTRQLLRTAGTQAACHAHPMCLEASPLVAARFSTIPEPSTPPSPPTSQPSPLTSTQTVIKHPISCIHPFLEASEREDLEQFKEDTFAVIKMSGTQYKVAKDDVVVTNLIHGYDIGDTIENTDVLLVGSQDETVIGRPLVSGAKVSLAVEEITKDKKVVVFKKKRRKGYQRKKGFRRDVLILRVTDIDTGDVLAKQSE